MKTVITALVAILISSGLATDSNAITMETIESRIGLGLTPDSQGFPAFFAPASGFVQGNTSHTNTISYTDGIVQADYTLTIEGINAAGAPAGLQVNNQATGVELGVENTQLDSGESIKVTFDNIVFSVVGVHPDGPVDVSSFATLLGSVRLAAFDDGIDTFTYAGVGDAFVVGDDTQEIDFAPSAPVVTGDTFTITADGGAFRALYISLGSDYKTIPEPATFALMTLSLVAMAATRRKS